MILFRKNYSKWFDVGCFIKSGNYYLMQMCYHLKTNKKVFRQRSMGFVNDFTNRPEIFKNSIEIKLEG
jgi:hypothetical protein